MNDIFEELGGDRVDEVVTLDDAKMIAEESGDQSWGVVRQERQKCGGKNCYSSRSESERVRKLRVKSHQGTPNSLMKMVIRSFICLKKKMMQLGLHYSWKKTVGFQL